MKYGISSRFTTPEGWRYYFVFDENAPSGPFTADLIEPYIHICHDMIDMDVSNLYVQSGYTKDLGMRLDLHNVGITLDDVVTNCLKKQYKNLRSDMVEERS